MAHKELTFRGAAREKILRGATQLADAVRITLGPKSKSVLIQKTVGRTDRLQRRRHDRQGDRAGGSGGEPRRPDAAPGGGEDRRRRRRRHQHRDHPGPRDLRRRRAQRRRRRQRDRPQARARSRRSRWRSRRSSRCRGRSRPARRRPRSRPSRPTTIRPSASWSRDAMEKVGGEGVITVEESKTTETVLEVVEGMQFDRGYLSPYFVTDPENMEAVLEDACVLLIRPQDQHPQGPAAAARAGRQERPPAAVRRRGRRGRGAGDAGRQPAPRRPQELRRQGAGVRRSAQGDAAGHRGADRRPGDLRGARD